MNLKLKEQVKAGELTAKEALTKLVKAANVDEEELKKIHTYRWLKKKVKQQ